jgi:hypothetical protein
MKGILLIAAGHPYYGKMAVNLALGLKNTQPDVNITLAYESTAISHLNANERALFNLIEIPKEYYHRSGVLKEYIKIKTHLNDLSPYEDTIYLDVDMVWNTKPVSELFESLKDKNLVIQNRGFCDMAEPKEDYSWWCNIKELGEKYKIKKGKYYSFSSEFIYFKKGKQTDKFFKQAKENYEELKINYTMFGGGIPDELIFSLTSLQLGLAQPIEYYTPIYWEQAENRKLNGAGLNQYYAYSIGGSSQSSKEQVIYNNLVQYHANKMGFVNLWKAKNKREYLPQRQRL